MNKTETKNIIHLIQEEMDKNEDLIGTIITRNQQLDVAIRNLQGWITDNGTLVENPELPKEALEPIPNKRDIVRKKKIACPVCKKSFYPQGIYPHLRSMHPEYEGAVKPQKKKKQLHWTQKPENKNRVKRWMKHMNQVKERKAA